MATLKVGWYPDPVDPQLVRYFDGKAWTTRTIRSDDSHPVSPPEVVPVGSALSHAEPPDRRRRARAAHVPTKEARFRADLKQLIELRRATFDAVNTGRVPQEMAAIYADRVEQCVVPDPDGHNEWGITWLAGSPKIRRRGRPWQRATSWPPELAA